MNYAHMIVGQKGEGSFPEHSGKIVFPRFFGEMKIERDGQPDRLVKLFKVNPTLYSAAGGEIVWQEKHLQRLEDFPKEDLLAEEIKHFLKTL